MSSSRALAPKSNISHVSGRDRTEGSSAASNSSTKEKRHRHSDADWESQKNTIANLYVQEELTAEDVIDELAKHHGFKVG
jgi:hypothetical protein